MQLTSQEPVSLTELPLKEEIMTDRDIVFEQMVEKELAKLEEQEKYNNLKDAVLGQSITTYSNYNTRNRQPQTVNPFFLDNSGTYRVEILTPGIPGESKKEQLNYI